MIVIPLAATFAAHALSRMRHERTSNGAAAAATAIPRLHVEAARSAALEAKKVLPGSALSLWDEGLYPRVTGYIKPRLVDVGDRVQEGQLLATIDAPDLDHQLALGRAKLALPKANREKAKADAELAANIENRDRILSSAGVARPLEYQVERKTYEVDKAAVRAADAAIKVQEAEIEWFTDLQAFEKVVAPFPGIITARGIDPGDPVSAGSTNRELFHLMRTDPVRVFVNVPRVFATDIRLGQRAVVYHREEPQKLFCGTVSRTADTFDPDKRSLRTEVQVANLENVLRPGMRLQVKFVFPNEHERS